MEVTNIARQLFLGCGEGPHYDENSDQLFFVDFPIKTHHPGRIFRCKYGDNNNTMEIHDMGRDFPSFVIPAKSDSLLVGRGKDLVELNWPQGGKASDFSVVVSVKDDRETLFNDAKCDPRGRLVVGTASDKDPTVVLDDNQASIYGIDTDRKLHVLDNSYSYCNGMAWTQDERNFFFIDSWKNKVFVYDYDPDSFSIGNRRVLFDFGSLKVSDGSFADGCCIDSNNRLWIACFCGGRVICVDANTGQLASQVKIPTTSPTSCCFAEPSLNELVVTSSAVATNACDESAGSLFVVRNTGASGYGGVRFGA